jgi:hypothetical protein
MWKRFSSWFSFIWWEYFVFQFQKTFPLPKWLIDIWIQRDTYLLAAICRKGKFNLIEFCILNVQKADFLLRTSSDNENHSWSMGLTSAKNWIFYVFSENNLRINFTLLILSELYILNLNWLNLPIFNWHRQQVFMNFL